MSPFRDDVCGGVWVCSVCDVWRVVVLGMTNEAVALRTLLWRWLPHERGVPSDMLAIHVRADSVPSVSDGCTEPTEQQLNAEMQSHTTPQHRTPNSHFSHSIL